MNLPLHKITETATTITLGWIPTGNAGYRFTREKAAGKFSHTWDKTRNSAKFSKDSAWYVVEAISGAAAGKYTPRIPPPPPPATGFSFAGKGLFTTSETAAANGLNVDWTAIQKDPEGDQHPGAVPGRLCYWQARATQPVVDEAKQHSIPYIGQAENQAELDKCLALNTDGLVAKGLVGNAGSWTPDGARKAAAQGWDLIQEWYKNAHPWESAPDAHGYPRFVSVCFGIYSEGDPGGQGHVQQIPLADYLAVWHGSYSIWRTESLTPADRALING